MSGKKEQKLGENLENWMSKLPPELRTIPFISLAIPGTHDTMTFEVSTKSDIAPDAEPIMQCLKFLGPLTTFIMSRWAKTQDYNVLDQLKAGIRYFDLRIATKKNTEKLYFVHALYAGEVQEKFKEILSFLKEHPKEIIILDCQHFYSFEDEHHKKLLGMINQTFTSMLLPYSYDMSKLSLDYLTVQNNYQVIVIYRDMQGRDNIPKLWPSDNFPSPWANTDDIPTLFTKLDRTLSMKNDKKAFITQCILTPSSEFVTKHLFSTLKKKCVVPLHNSQYEWLAKQKPGPKGVNIIINDFVNLRDQQFPKEVIQLNTKLLNNQF